MKVIRKATYAIFTTFLVVSSYQCSSPKQVAFQTQSELNVGDVVFQEWYAGIKVGGTGFNIFLPNLIKNDNVVLENVYFRNLKGTWVEDKGVYSAVLKNNSQYYTWEYPEKPADYPFDLTANECVISYKENGQTKYYKVSAVNERVGAYYENGHPSLHKNNQPTILATVDED